MFRVLLSMGDGYVEVGSQAKLELALHHADNLGTAISEGGRVPAECKVRVENVDAGIRIDQQFYNGFVRVLQSVGV